MPLFDTPRTRDWLFWTLLAGPAAAFLIAYWMLDGRSWSGPPAVVMGAGTLGVLSTWTLAVAGLSKLRTALRSALDRYVETMGR